MNRTTKPIAKCLSILLLITLFACHTNKESAIELFEYGRIMEERMQPDSAVVMYQRAIKQSMASKDTKLIGLIYNQLGDLYLSHYLFNKSLLSYQSGLKYNQLFLDKINASKSLRGIGKSYTYRSMPDPGLIYLSQALQLSESINDKEEVVRIHNNISNAYFELEQFDEALKHNIQALNMTKDSTSKYINSFARADIMYQLQKYDSAQYYYTISTQCKNLNTQAGSYYMLYELSKLLNNSDTAYYLSHFTTLRDSIEEISHPDLIQSAEYSYFTDNIITEQKNNLIFWIGFVLFLSSVVFLVTISMHKIKLRNIEKNRREEIKKLVKEMNRLHRKLAIHIKEKEKQTAKLSQVETMQKLSLIQNRIIDEMKKYATGCNESFVKSKFCVEMRIHFKKYPSLLTAKEQKKFSEVVNTKYHVFIQYLQAFTDMPEDDCLFCCLALAQFTTKECAFIRGVTNDAIRSQKTRIKKRLADSFASIELFEFIFSSKIKMNC